MQELSEVLSNTVSVSSVLPLAMGNLLERFGLQSYPWTSDCQGLSQPLELRSRPASPSICAGYEEFDSQFKISVLSAVSRMGTRTLACWILYNFFLFELRFSKTALLRVACRPNEPECLEVGPTILFCFCFHSKWCLCTINLRTALKAPSSRTTLSNNRGEVMVETKAMWCLQSVIRVFTALFMYLSLQNNYLQ